MGNQRDPLEETAEELESTQDEGPDIGAAEISLDELDTPLSPQEITLDELNDSPTPRLRPEGRAPQSIIPAISERETGGEADPASAIGDQGESIGVNQIQLNTAVQPGLPGVEPLAESREEAKEKLLDRETNNQYAADVFGGLLRKYDGNVQHAVAAYNWGQGNVDQWRERGAEMSDLPNDVKDYVNEVVPKMQRAISKTERAGVEVSETGAFSRLDQQASPQEKLKQRQEGEFIWKNAALQGAVWGIEAVEQVPRDLAEGLISGSKTTLGQISEAAEFIERATDFVQEVDKDLLSAGLQKVGVSEQDAKDVSEDVRSAADVALPFDGVAKTFAEYSAGIDRPRDPTKGMALYNPRRLARTFGETVPTTIGIAAAFLANPTLGVLTAAGLEGGGYLEELDRLEQSGEADISEGQKLLGAASVGAFNAALEKFGIDRIFSAARVPGLKRKIFQTIFGGATEGFTETWQEVNNIVASEIQRGTGVGEALLDWSERDAQRLTEAAYAGTVAGLGLSGAGAGVEATLERNRADAEYSGFRETENGVLEPRFQIIRPNHPRAGEVVRMEELESEDLRVPEYRTSLVEEAWLREENVPDEAVGVMMEVLDRRAAKLGISTEKLLEQEQLTPASEGIVSEDALEQFIGAKADLGSDLQHSLKRAKELEEQGFSQSEIYELTNWFKNPQDNKWRYEIFSGNMTEDLRVGIREAREADAPVFTTLGELVPSDSPLLDFYPELSEIEVALNPNLAGSNLGSFNRKAGKDKQNPSAWQITLNSARPERSVQETLYHEIQHAIQSIEGFARGGNKSMKEVLRRANDELAAKVEELDALERRLNTIEDLLDEFRDDEGIVKANADMERVQELLNAKNKIIRQENLVKIQMSDLRSNSPEQVQAAYENVAGEIEARVAAERADTRALKETMESKASAMLGENVELEGAALGLSNAEPRAELQFEENPEYPVWTHFDDPVRQTLESRARGEGLNQNTRGVTKGAVENLFRDGRTIIRLMKTADATTLVHELAHVFTSTLTESEADRLRTELGVQDLTTTEFQEKFAAQFEAFVTEGESSNPAIQSELREYREFMTDVYGQMSGTEVDTEINEGLREFLDDLFDQRVNEEPQRSWHQKFIDYFSVEKRFQRIGQDQTGFHIKNFFTEQQRHVENGKALVETVSRLLDGDKARMRTAMLIAESDQRIAQLEEGTDMKRAVKAIRDYFDQALAEYRMHGYPISDFSTRLVDEVQAKIESLEKEDGDVQDQRAQLNELQEQLAKAKDINFVHIPIDAWIRPMMEQAPTRAARFLRVMNNSERSTWTIQDLLDNSEVPLDRDMIDLQDVIQSYSSRRGKDIAMLKIKNAAFREGAASRSGNLKHDPPKEASVFEDMKVNRPVAEWLDTFVNVGKAKSKVRSAISLSKMLAFWNPLFLSMYDVLQGAALGVYDKALAGAAYGAAVGGTAGGPIGALAGGATGAAIGGATILSKARRAAKDVFDMSDTYNEAFENGLFSKPYGSPLRQRQKEFNKAFWEGKNGSLGTLVSEFDWALNGPKSRRIAERIADVEEASTDFGDYSPIMQKNMVSRLASIPYELSWNTAWTGDAMVRMTTYRYLREEKGMSARQAAQTAATVHGDYAGVPQDTRDTLNAFFFTPTFKIAMGKFFAKSMQGIGEVVTDRANQTDRMYASVPIRVGAILIGFDMLMTGALGMEREEFGRAYCRPADTTRMNERICYSWSTPVNLFSKYAFRTWEAFNEPDSFNPVYRLFQSNKWEITPMWRIMLEIGMNDKGGGEKVYNEFDPPITKTLDMLDHAASSIIGLYGAVLGKDPAAEGREVTQEELAQHMPDELAQLTGSISALFVFPYKTDSEIQIERRALNRILRRYMDVAASEELSRLIREDADPEQIDEFWERFKGRNENFRERIRQQIERIQDATADTAVSGDTMNPSLLGDPEEGGPTRSNEIRLEELRELDPAGGQ